MAGLAIATAVHAARFELSPASAALNQGCDSVVNIVLSTEGSESDAANVIIQYNPAEVEITDTNPAIPGIQIGQGNAYDIYADNIVDPAIGQIRLTGFSIGHAYNSGLLYGVFGSIPFKSRPGIAAATFTIFYEAGSTLDSNIAEYITSDDLLTGVRNGSYTFAVGECVSDVTPPWVTNPQPAPGSTGVPLSSNTTFHILDNMSGVDLSSLRINVQGIEYNYDGVNRFSYSGTALDYAITIDPIADFPDGVMVRVEVNGRDLDGNTMSPYRWYFNEPPIPPPVPPTCTELGCPEPDECAPPEELPACEEPEVLPIPEPTVPPGEQISIDAIEFLAANRTVRLYPDGVNAVRVLVGTSYSVQISHENLAKEVGSIWWYSGASTYQLAQSAAGDFWTDIGAYASITAVPSHIIINYADGTIDVRDFTVRTVPRGNVYEQIGENESMVSGARVTIYQAGTTPGIWNAGTYNQINPVWTSNDGQFGFYVPQGYYYIEVQKPGYDLARSLSFYARSSIVNNPMLLTKIPGPVTPIDAITQTAVLVGETVADMAARTQSAIVAAIPATQEQIDSAVGIIAPAAIGLAFLNLGTAISFANLIPFLWGLFTQPLLLLGRGKRKRWGVVYNSLTKIPIDLAIVRLIEARTGKIIRTRITDREGRYFFMAKLGIYRIEVKKPGFLFPTINLRDAKEDFQYLDVYHGEIIQVREESRQITANIPLDPIAGAEKSKWLIVRSYLKKAQQYAASLSVMVAIGLLVVNPSWFMLGYLILQIALLLLFRRLAQPAKPKGWGIVYDKKTRRPIANAIVRIFDLEFSRLLETQVTDGQGKYSFLVGSNRYFTTYEKPGFVVKKLAPIDYSKMKERTMVAYDVGLERAKDIAASEQKNAASGSVQVGGGEEWKNENRI